MWTNKPNFCAWEQFLLDVYKNNWFFAFPTVYEVKKKKSSDVVITGYKCLHEAENSYLPIIASNSLASPRVRRVNIFNHS